MGPLEVYYGTIALIVVLIGLARGYAKELGSTMIILVTIFLLLFFQERIDPLLLRIGEIVVGEDANDQLIRSLFYQIFFIAAVFAGYAGRTINFPGRPLPPPQGTLLSLLIGAINGYLIAGTLWYYQVAYDYPFRTILGIDPALTELGDQLVTALPQTLLPSPTYWMIPIAILLLLRVRG